MRPFLSQHSQWMNYTNSFTVVQGLFAAAVSANKCPPPAVSVRVAVLLTSFAITKHAARWVLNSRGHTVESVVAQICRDGGARLSTNVIVKDLDIA